VINSGCNYENGLPMAKYAGHVPYKAPDDITV
jgi:hypothetical protein